VAHSYFKTLVHTANSYLSHDSFTWLTHTCDMTDLCVWHDSSIHVTWLIYMHMCEMTHSYVWHDSFMCVTCFVIWLCTRGASNKQKRTWLMHMRLLSTLAVCVAVRCSVCVVVRVARVEICTREWFVWFCYRGSLFFFGHTMWYLLIYVYVS